jgi:hypothetical protein
MEVVRNRLDIDAILSGQKPCVLGREDEYVGLLVALLMLELVDATELVLSLRRLGGPSLDAPAIRSTLNLRIVGASRCAQCTISMSPSILFLPLVNQKRARKALERVADSDPFASCFHRPTSNLDQKCCSNQTCSPIILTGIHGPELADV